MSKRRDELLAKYNDFSNNGRTASAEIIKDQIRYLDENIGVIALEIIMLAEMHQNDKCDMQSSAYLCLDDAYKNMANRNCKHAAERAIKSLEYSVGKFHPDYAGANKIFEDYF